MLMKAEFLTSKNHYAQVMGRRGSRVSRLIVMKTVANELEHSRCGLVVSRRVGKAVVRNRVRRRLREILRQLQIKPGWDIVLIARASAATAGYTDIEKEVRTLLAQANLLAGDYEEAFSRAN
jgi:ribonuclease P protein component